MTIPSVDALSALTQGQLPNVSALNANPPAGAIPMGLTAPVSEGGFSQMLQNPLSAQAAQNPLSVQAAGGGASPSTWGHMVQQMVMSVNDKQASANALVNDVLKGGPTPVHEATIATEESSLSFEFLAEVRNKVLDAYNQVMQMQV